MADANSYSGDEYSDDEEDGEELDPRVQDELEKLNVAANSINHLEAELDEARAVFRQTMAAATYHLNAQIKKVGHKNIEKARPFYDVLREMRKAHFELQRATLQYEKANSRHVYARQRVHDAEHRVFSCGEKRVFDTALQEMLNQATIEVNEAENQKKESWVAHQKMYKSYQDVGKKAKEMQNKLRKHVEKTRPYFAQKVGFDRHLWQLKVRVDSIQKGLSEAKQIYSRCLKSLEKISDDIHQKRKDRKTMAMIANLQEREAGVGADSEDEVSLDQSQLDLDLDCNTSISEVDGILPDNLPDIPSISSTRGTEGPSASAAGVATGREDMSLESASRGTLDRQVSGAESSDSQASLVGGSLKREVYGCEQGESEAGNCSSERMQTKETEKIGEVKTLKSDDRSSVRTGASENSTFLTAAKSSELQDSGDIAREGVDSLEENMSQDQPGATNEVHKQSENFEGEGNGVGPVQEEDQCQTIDPSVSPSAVHTQNQKCTSSDSEPPEATDEAVVVAIESKHISQSDDNSGNQNDSQDVSQSSDGESLENGEWI